MKQQPYETSIWNVWVLGKYELLLVVKSCLLVVEPCLLESNSNGSCQKWGVKCHFATLNSVLAPLNSAFPPMVGAKWGTILIIQFFLLKNIIKLNGYILTGIFFITITI